MENQCNPSPPTEHDPSPPTLSTLPPELQLLVLEQLSLARDLRCALLVCRAWLAPVSSVAAKRLLYVAPTAHVALRIDRNGDTRAFVVGGHLGFTGSILHVGGVLRILDCAEKLSARIGPWPANRRWRDEWAALRMAQARLLARNNGTLAAFEERMGSMSRSELDAIFSSGGLSIGKEAEDSYASSIAWKLERRWPRETAIAVSLLSSRCASALTESIRERRSDFAASCWTLCMALWERAWLQEDLTNAADGHPAPRAEELRPALVPPGIGSDEVPPAEELPWAPEAHSTLHPSPSTLVAAPRLTPPPSCCYLMLDGEFGLATDDPTWEVLRARDVQLGLSFTTCNVCFAMEANEQSFPNGDGFHAPITTWGRTGYELARSDLVCFRPGRGHVSHGPLVATDEAIYRLPPLLKMTLVAIDEAGEWEARDQIFVQRRLFTVVADWADFGPEPHPACDRNETRES